MNDRERPAIDVSRLPTVVFGHRATIWMGNLGYMAIEGTMFLMVIVSYFYLRTRVNDWPPEQVAPGLLWGTANLIVFLISLVPNFITKRETHRGNVRGVRLWLSVLIAFGALNILLRVMEFPALNCKWNENAYASAIFVLIGLHSAHLLTAWIENIFLASVLFAGHTEGHRLVDVEQSANYWYFLVLFNIAIYLLIYIARRGMRETDDTEHKRAVLETGRSWRTPPMGRNCRRAGGVGIRYRDKLCGDISRLLNGTRVSLTPDHCGGARCRNRRIPERALPIASFPKSLITRVETSSGTANSWLFGDKSSALHLPSSSSRAEFRDGCCRHACDNAKIRAVCALCWVCPLLRL